MDSMEWMCLRIAVVTGGCHTVPCTALAVSQVDSQPVLFSTDLERFQGMQMLSQGPAIWHLSQCPGGSSMAASSRSITKVSMLRVCRGQAMVLWTRRALMPQPMPRRQQSGSGTGEQGAACLFCCLC